MTNPTEHLTILVVDDTPANVTILESILGEDHKVLTAMDGEAGLDMVYAHRPDLILLDIMMPGMDGYEVCRRLREDQKTRNIPVIFITAMSEADDEAKGLDLGAIDYIIKPFNAGLVKKRVDNHLRLVAQRDELGRLNNDLKNAYDRIASEIALVSDLQQRLLPPRPLHMKGLDLKSMYKPSAMAGGDYFDYFKIGNRAMRIIIADVSGHGAEAAFIMGMVRTMFHVGKENYRNLSSTMDLVNSRLCEIIRGSGYFVTALVLELNTRLQTLEFINAGHCPGLLRQPRQGLRKLEPQTPPLGIMEVDFESEKIAVPEGFDVFLYTDGLYEWEHGDSWYGLEPFIELCSGLLDQGPDMLPQLRSALDEVAGRKIEFGDDITSVWAKWSAPEATVRIPEKKPKVLIVDDAPVNIRVLAEVFRDGHEALVATNGRDAVAIAMREEPDLILLDIEMPEMNGYQVCEKLKATPETEAIPIIFITAKSEEDDEARGLELGAVDYISKPFSLPIVKARAKAQLDLKLKTDKLKSLASLDGLTGLYNRRKFNDYMAARWKGGKESGIPLALFMIDLDYFRKYNDNYGHLAGDSCLQDVGAALNSAMSGREGIAARYGGEEFVVLVPGLDLDGAEDLAATIRESVLALDIEHSHSPAAAQLTVSIGFTSGVPTGETSMAALVEVADSMLYEAKKRGRNRVEGQVFAAGAN